MIHDYSTYLAGRGHRVHIVTSTPGRARRVHQDGVDITYVRQLSHPLLYRYAPLLRQVDFSISAAKVLIQERADVAHLWSYSGINWAPALRRMIDLPYLVQFMMWRHEWKWRLDRQMFDQYVRRADRLMALSQAGADEVARQHGRSCGVLSPPVDMDVFRPVSARSARPVVFFPADLSDRRKGGMLLLRAWNKVFQERPDATLVLAGPFGLAGYHQGHFLDAMLGQFNLVRDPEARAAIEVRGVGEISDLPTWYSQAWVTVLPSYDEAFGMVLTESLACGTPVVASSHGGPGEIIGSDRVGRTVELRDQLDVQSVNAADDLADALISAMDLSTGHGTREQCREWASQWSLDRIGPQVEETLESIVEEFHGSSSRTTVS